MNGRLRSAFELEYEPLHRQHFFENRYDSYRLSALVFMSKATFDLGLMGVLHLFAQAHRNNLSRKITGALYYDGLEFYQVIEGDPNSVDDLWEIIQKDYRHKQVRLISKNGIVMRSHQHWSMYVKGGTQMAHAFPQYRNLIGDLRVDSVREMNLHQ